jgi:hypothetical protein
MHLAKDLHQEHARKMIEPKGEWSVIGLSGEYPYSTYNGRKGIQQYRGGSGRAQVSRVHNLTWTPEKL